MVKRENSQIFKQGYVYLIHALGTNHYKIGLAGNPEKRLSQLQTGSAQELKIMKAIAVRNMQGIESALHNKYAAYRIRDNSEWFEFSDDLRDQVIVTMKGLDLDRQTLIGGGLMSYRDYSRQVVLQKRRFDLDTDGEIIVEGIRLKDTMPQAPYELFLKGLEAELALEEVEVLRLKAVACPDKVMIETQALYGAQMRSLINNLFNKSYLIPDGADGCSLVEHPPKLLVEMIEQVKDRGEELYFKNNSALIHSAVLRFIKDKTGRSWSEHYSEQQYQEAVKLTRQFLLRFAEQL